MIDQLNTEAERRAEAAEQLFAFSGLKLLHIKRQLEILLGLIGRNGIFDQYTRHDISHIDAMLALLDWLIPETTKQILTPSDWLTIVLAIYFHDLGMLVTPDEYAKRASSGFPAFVQKKLFQGDGGKDYEARIENLSPDDRERFLYQEFVRSNHAERVKWWIMGEAASHLGVTNAAIQEVDKLFGVLPPQFRRDLGLVCESHHRDDLGEFSKYKTSQPYGQSDKETVNLQYACLILRTSDLLHITQDRTPSIEFRLINPADPISQQEWAKQRAVTSVRAQLGKDKDGNLDSQAPRNTIEVFAFFEREDGFFGLTSYLKYVRDELKISYDWSQAARLTQSVKLDFPWRWLDDQHIEAKNFLPKPFVFTIDETRILDLLTGNTLYNDTGVVLRELVQNSLDAVRLQYLEDSAGNRSASVGTVQISWNSRTRSLTVTDKGTGMTQAVIEENLLKVGSSRYQGPEFKKKYPAFSSISRFGIGVLSTFMIADSVEITTCSKSEDKARHLSLRSVHGRYLIRLLNKDDAVVKDVLPHGTRVTVTVRPSAKVADILETARKWIVVPGCDVTVSIDDATPVRVGFTSPREFINSYLLEKGLVSIASGDQPEDGSIRVEQRDHEGTTLAYGLRWSGTFKEWSFVTSPLEASGTLIEGIRVEFGTPGFSARKILACCNATGAKSPKTNVARSGLEATDERRRLLESIYSTYAAHLTSEVQSLQSRGFSKTWAASEVKYLLSPLLATPPLDDSALAAALATVPMLVVEESRDRELWSLGRLNGAQRFWTIEWPIFNSGERLVAEAPNAGSVSTLIDALGYQDLPLPSGPTLCSNTFAEIDRGVFQNRELVEVSAYPRHGRIDLCWQESNRAGELVVTARLKPLINELRTATGIHGQERQEILLAASSVLVTGIELPPTVIRTRTSMLFLGGRFTQRCRPLVASASTQREAWSDDELRLATLLAGHAVSKLSNEKAADLLGIIRQHIQRRHGKELIDQNESMQIADEIREFIDGEYDVYARSRPT